MPVAISASTSTATLVRGAAAMQRQQQRPEHPRERQPPRHDGRGHGNRERGRVPNPPGAVRQLGSGLAVDQGTVQARAGRRREHVDHGFQEHEIHAPLAVAVVPHVRRRHRQHQQRHHDRANRDTDLPRRPWDRLALAPAFGDGQAGADDQAEDHGEDDPPGRAHEVRTESCSQDRGEGGGGRRLAGDGRGHQEHALGTLDDETEAPQENERQAQRPRRTHHAASLSRRS